MAHRVWLVDMSLSWFHLYVVVLIGLSLRLPMCFFFFLMIRRPPRSTQSRSSAASDVYKRQVPRWWHPPTSRSARPMSSADTRRVRHPWSMTQILSLIHISEPTRLLSISYAVFCLKKKKKRTRNHTYTNKSVVKDKPKLIEHLNTKPSDYKITVQNND